MSSSLGSEPCPEFGVRLANEVYRPRPASYAVCLRRVDSVDMIAAVKVPQGLFLPGGGADDGEAPEEALRREVLEECGRSITLLARLGVAVEYVHAPGEGCFAKECTFFLVQLSDTRLCDPEADHELIWIPLPKAIAQLTHQSQAWAVSLSLSVISASDQRSNH